MYPKKTAEFMCTFYQKPYSNRMEIDLDNTL